jgi:hypothetical protein
MKGVSREGARTGDYPPTDLGGGRAAIPWEGELLHRPVVTPTQAARLKARKRFSAEIAQRSRNGRAQFGAIPASVLFVRHQLHYLPPPQPYIGSVRRRSKFSEIHRIIEAVCAYYRKSELHLLGNQRAQEIAMPRMVAMYLACEMSGHSSPEIGRAMGGRDHSTIIHGRNKIRCLIETDEVWSNSVETIRKQLEVTAPARFSVTCQLNPLVLRPQQQRTALWTSSARKYPHSFSV